LPDEEERPIRFICLERTFGGFSFSVSLKWPIDAAKVSAQLTDGVLQIRLPKTSACGREISVPISE
jgi:HSP20 family molecular chaperone IbpA